MKLPRTLAAAALALGAFGLGSAAQAQDMRHDMNQPGVQHTEVRRTVTRTEVHTNHGRDDQMRHHGWDRRHHGWQRRQVRTCRNVWRDHARVRTCRTVWRNARY